MGSLRTVIVPAATTKGITNAAQMKTKFAVTLIVLIVIDVCALLVKLE